MNWLNQPILVTGGCGFIGANLVRHLVDRGALVTVLDDLSVGRPENVADFGVRLVRGDLREADEALRHQAVVVHLAASTGVIDSVQDPARDFDLNARGTLNLLRAAVRHPVEKFIFASSNAALGQQEPPLHEGLVPRPLSPYGASKLAGEGYCSAFHGSYGLATVALRFANVYGPGSGHKTSVVAKWIQETLAGKRLTIYGDGQQTRDFIHVDDVCQAILKAVEAPVGGEVFQIGTGIETTILALFQQLQAGLGQPGEWQFAPARPGEIQRNYCDIAKARRVLGFAPQIALEEGLRSTCEWFLGARGGAPSTP